MSHRSSVLAVVGMVAMTACSRSKEKVLNGQSQRSATQGQPTTGPSADSRAGRSARAVELSKQPEVIYKVRSDLSTGTSTAGLEIRNIVQPETRKVRLVAGSKRFELNEVDQNLSLELGTRLVYFEAFGLPLRKRQAFVVAVPGKGVGLSDQAFSFGGRWPTCRLRSGKHCSSAKYRSCRHHMFDGQCWEPGYLYIPKGAIGRDVEEFTVSRDRAPVAVSGQGQCFFIRPENCCGPTPTPVVEYRTASSTTGVAGAIYLGIFSGDSWSVRSNGKGNLVFDALTAVPKTCRKNQGR